MSKLNERASRLAAGKQPARSRWPWVALLFLCAAACLAYPALRERRENALLNEELRSQQQRTKRLRGLVRTGPRLLLRGFF